MVWSWVISLRAYTVALKNLEGIPRQNKESHLQAVLNGWATMLRYACLLFERLLSEREFSVGHVTYKSSLPKNVKSSLIRMLFLNIPLIISHLLRSDLGSQKLSAQLKKVETADSMAVAFFQTGLYADLKLPGYLDQLIGLHKRVESSKFFLEALLMKLRDIYIRFNIEAGEHDRFRKLVLDVGADAKELKGRAQDDYAKDLDRRELIARLRSEKT